MIKESTLHILNGKAMYDFFKRTNFLKGEMMIPFNEAMCFGDTSDELFTREFSENVQRFITLVQNNITKLL